MVLKMKKEVVSTHYNDLDKSLHSNSINTFPKIQLGFYIYFVVCLCIYVTCKLVLQDVSPDIDVLLIEQQKTAVSSFYGPVHLYESAYRDISSFTLHDCFEIHKRIWSQNGGFSHYLPLNIPISSIFFNRSWSSLKNVPSKKNSKFKEQIHKIKQHNNGGFYRGK